VACGGVKITELLIGARSADPVEAAKFAGLQYLSYLVGRRIQVIMPYADRLAEFGKWYRQLWAESLGKKNQGPTPVAALGPVDQHSQIQLYNDGPDDKTITFIKMERFSERVKIPKGLPGLEYAAGRELSKIMKAELEGTAAALAKKKRPHAIITIPSISEKSLGALFYFFMLATAYSGELYGINTYDQPGVEEGKKITKKLLES
jgi:glucose-6-phosphate isomerase